MSHSLHCHFCDFIMILLVALKCKVSLLAALMYYVFKHFYHKTYYVIKSSTVCCSQPCRKGNTFRQCLTRTSNIKRMNSLSSCFNISIIVTTQPRLNTCYYIHYYLHVEYIKYFLNFDVRFSKNKILTFLKC